jgi:serpin B
VSAVIHSSTIEVTESGIEATAATVGVADPFGDPPPPPKREVEPKIKLFNADHPFLWFVVHRPTHLVLFAGRFTGETPQE